MSNRIERRRFLKQSLALSFAAPVALSFEERALFAQADGPAPPASASSSAKGAPSPMGAIGKVKVSRLICGGNLISGYAHSRDLIYVSRWLRKYFTDDKIMETWALCEQHGINTMILNPSDERAIGIYEKYRVRGGKIQYLAQIGPEKNDLATPVKQARDAGAVGAFLLGNVADDWTRSGALGKIGELISVIKSHGLISGVAGHELRVPKMVEEAGFEPDFYMKTLHSTNYWSQRRPDQKKEVIDNYSVDNYWCMDPEETIAYMRTVKRPWIAYKVLAAGALHPRAGFRYAFENGADFAAVGMFDFQVAEDVAMMNEVVPYVEKRQRAWYA
jgi:hypothetical protein